MSAFQINIAQNALKVHKVLEHMMMYINKLWILNNKIVLVTF